MNAKTYNLDFNPQFTELQCQLCSLDFNLPCGITSEPNEFPLSRLTLNLTLTLTSAAATLLPISSGGEIILLLGDLTLKQFGNTDYSESLFNHFYMSEVNGCGLLS